MSLYAAYSLRLAARDTVLPPLVGSAAEVERLVTDATGSERVQAAIVVWSGGDMARLRDAVALASADWRDVLVRADLADEDGSSRLDAELGTTTP